MYSEKMWELDHPHSDTVPFAPGVAPSNKPSIILAPGNTKNGGTCWPAPLTHPIKVDILDFPDVMAWAL